MEDKNYATDFVDALNSNQPGTGRRGIPKTHPSADYSVKYIDTAINKLGEDLANTRRGEQSLLEMPKRGYKTRYKQFNLAYESEAQRLEEIIDKCLSSPGWILAREEWDTNKEGEKIVTVKYLEPTETKFADKNGEKPTKKKEVDTVDHTDVED